MSILFGLFRKKTGFGIFFVNVIFWAFGSPAVAANYTITVNGNDTLGRLEHFWEECVGTGHMFTALDPMQLYAYRLGYQELGFKRIRGHAIFHEDIGVFKWDGVNAPTYNWKIFDAVMDSILATGIRPIMELNPMPYDLASDPAKFNMWYQGIPDNVSPPKDYTKWRDLCYETAKHCEAKYGKAEVESWYWEIWNEPDHENFWLNKDTASYFKLYEASVNGLTAANPNLKIGGPATTNPNVWLGYLTDRSKKKGWKLDFLSYHRYGGSPSNASRPSQIIAGHKSGYQAIVSSGLKLLNFNTEYNSTYAGAGGRTEASSVSMDTHFNAVFVIAIMKRLFDVRKSRNIPLPNILSYWVISDVFDERDFAYVAKHPPFYSLFGIISWHGIRKPVFNGFKMLHMLGTERIGVTGGAGTGKFGDEASIDGVDGIASLNATKDEMQVIVYNFYDAINTTGTDSVTVQINNIPFTPGKVRLRYYGIDQTHSNAYTEWVKQGKPDSAKTDWAALRAAQYLEEIEPSSVHNLTNGSLTKKIFLSRQGVTMFVLSKDTGLVAARPLHAPMMSAQKRPFVKMVAKGRTVEIEYRLSSPAHVSLGVYNAAGVLLTTLVKDFQAANAHTVVWDRTDARGNPVPRGVYFLRCTAGGFSTVGAIATVR